MGCDIHIVVERRLKGRTKWVGLYSSDAAYQIIRKNMIAARRDYGFFADLASVRGQSSLSQYPQNLPEDMSDLTREQFWRSPTDYHSASHMTIDQFTKTWMHSNQKLDEQWRSKDIRSDYAAYDLLGVSPDDFDDDKRPDYRVVFWFDN